MIVIVPMRAALGFAATLLASSLAIEARAQDASPWQRDGHSAVRLLAGSHSGAVLLGGIAFQLQPGWKTYWRTPGDSGGPPRFDFSKSEKIGGIGRGSGWGRGEISVVAGSLKKKKKRSRSSHCLLLTHALLPACMIVQCLVHMYHPTYLSSSVYRTHIRLLDRPNLDVPLTMYLH